ncbi:MAG: hypothetical protein NTW66_00810 [Candidatus Magasanikbacteria bacterium]|nr:hypothetical protein [Candidatus Magasanikbacteria bacterium]
MINNEPTTGDILEAINNFAEKVDERFEKIDGRFDRLEQKVDQNHLELSGQLRMMEIDIKDIKERLTRLEK